MTLARPRPALSAELLLRAYAHGWFPMAQEDGEIHWHDPDPRAINPLEAVRPGRTMRRILRQEHFRLTCDTAFEQVIRACARRDGTWITGELIEAYVALHIDGHAHSVEAWKDDGLVGGIYGVSIGGAFFGESMFSTENNASKAAFHQLVHHLRRQGFTLLDSQYINDFTRTLGAIEIPRTDFRRLLAAASSLPVTF